MVTGRWRNGCTKQCLVKPHIQVLAQTPEEGVQTPRAARDTQVLSGWPETKKPLLRAPFLGFVITVGTRFIQRTFFYFPDIPM